MSIIQKSHKSLEYDKILSELAVFAKTEQSKLQCLGLTPFVRHNDIERELNYTAEAKKILDNSGDIPIEKTQDFKKIREKNEYFVEDELVNIAKTLRIFRLVRNFLKENLETDSQMTVFVENIYTNKILEDKIKEYNDA